MPMPKALPCPYYVMSPLPLFVSLIDEVFLYGLLVESKDPSYSFHRTLVEGPKDVDKSELGRLAL